MALCQLQNLKLPRFQEGDFDVKRKDKQYLSEHTILIWSVTTLKRELCRTGRKPSSYTKKERKTELNVLTAFIVVMMNAYD